MKGPVHLKTTNTAVTEQLDTVLLQGLLTTM